MSRLLRRAVFGSALALAMAFVWGTACADPLLHTVRTGDSLWVIAKRYGVSAQDVARVNGLGDGNAIHPGTRLVVPQRGGERTGRSLDGFRPASIDPPARSPQMASLAVPPQYGDVPKPAESAYSMPPLVREAAPDASPAPTRPAVQTAARPLAASPTRPAEHARAVVTINPPAARRPEASELKHPIRPARVAAHDRAEAVKAQDTPVPAVAPPTSAESTTPAVAATPSGIAPEVAPPAADVVPAANPLSLAAKPGDLKGLNSEPKPESSLFGSAKDKPEGYGIITALDLALKLVVVIILAYVCMLALKKYTQRRMAGSAKGAGLKVVDTIGLAPNRQLHIVTLGDKSYLLGSTPDAVSLIADVSEAQGNAAAGGGRSEPVDPAFSQRIKELMKAAPAPRPPASDSSGVGSRLAQAARFIQARSNQMRPLGEIIDETISS